MKTLFCLLTLLIATGAVCQDEDLCSLYTYTRYYNNGYGPWWAATGTVGHNSGAHNAAVELWGRCWYLTQGTEWCEVIADSDGDSLGAIDNGTLTNPFMEHDVSADARGGGGSSNGPSITTVATGAAGASSCLRKIGCSVSLIWDVKPFGIGTTVDFTNKNLNFDEKFPYQRVCGPEHDPAWNPNGGPCPGGICSPSQPTQASCAAVPVVGRHALWTHIEDKNVNVAAAPANLCK
jgi:hypothetical protein